MHHARCTLVAVVIAAAITLSTSAPAETHHVDVGPGFDFIPADITIQTGDTVVWTWVSGLHNVESGVDGNHDGNFRSGDPVNDPGLTYEVTFDQQFLDDHPMEGNVYPYYCSIHVNFNMIGSVTVEPAPVECPADIVGDDDTVDVNDLLELLANWGTDGNGAAIAEPNDVVNVDDLLALLSAWGPCE